MSIGVVGVNHSCPIAVREKVSFTHTRKVEALHDLKKLGIKEVVILSTCNRTEIYMWDEDLEGKMELVKDFCSAFLTEEELETYFIYKTDKKAVKHLFDVAAGLDSLVIGEDQILGQVKEAWEIAADQKSSGKMLNKIFREAVSTAKRIKHTLKISENPLSISYIAVKFLKEKMGDLSHKKLLVIGLGKMSQLVIKYLQEEQLETIYVSNRSHNRAEALSSTYENVVSVTYKERYALLNQVDAVICATASPHIILQKQLMPELNHKLYMLDIALPRDIDPEVGSLPGAVLYDIDDLKIVCKKNNQRRKELAKAAKEIIKEDMAKLMEWIELAAIDNTLELLNQKKDEIQKYTLEYIYRKTDLSVKDKKIIDKMVGAALKNLVSTPLTNLKKIKDKNQREQYVKVLEELFEL